jgi:hypothetical protein
MPRRGQPEDADGEVEIAYRTQALRSHASVALACAIVCHCKIRDFVGVTAGERHDMIFPISGARAACQPC